MPLKEPLFADSKVEIGLLVMLMVAPPVTDIPLTIDAGVKEVEEILVMVFVPIETAIHSAEASAVRPLRAHSLARWHRRTFVGGLNRGGLGRRRRSRLPVWTLALALAPASAGLDGSGSSRHCTSSCRSWE